MLKIFNFLGDIKRLVWGILFRKPTNFSWIINNTLAGSGKPMSRKEIEWLYKQGIRAIITLTEEPLPSRILQNLDLSVDHFPVKNHTAPSPEKLQQIIDRIHHYISQKKPVLVHCAAGQGRTGMILAAYLIKFKNMQPNEAIKLIRKLRRGSIEKIQEKALLNTFRTNYL
ncbi:MAG: dual specificity protein phosphatase family protein [Thermoprotei archaeon]